MKNVNELVPRLSIVLLTSKSKVDAEGRYPIVIRIYDPWTKKNKDYRTGNYSKPEAFELTKGSSQVLYNRAKDIIDRFRLNKNPFTFQSFEKHFVDKNDSLFTLTPFLSECAKNVNTSATKTSILDLISIFERIYGNKPIYLGSIDYSFVIDFRNRLRSLKKSNKNGVTNSLSENTVRFHLRTFRACYNQAIKQNIITPTKSPFLGIDTQSKPSDKPKRYLTTDEIRIFINHQYCLPASANKNKPPQWELSRDLFLMSYVTCGLNLKDILSLKWSNIHHNCFVIVRKKTSNKLTIPISKYAQVILDKRSKSTTYIFEEFIPEGNGDVYEANYNNLLGVVVDNIKRISEQAGIRNPKEINFYTARHSFAVHYMQNTPGASIFNLMTYLGHTDEKSTRNYLQSLIGNQEIKEVGFLDSLVN